MSEKILWKQDYTIGVEEIDVQHHYFSILVNRLMDDLAQIKDDYYRARLLEELSRYASFHFISEENIMLRCSYPGLKDHQELHRHLINELNEKINYFTLSKLSSDAVLTFLIDWFVNHTLEIDKKFGHYCEGVKRGL